MSELIKNKIKLKATKVKYILHKLQNLKGKHIRIYNGPGSGLKPISSGKIIDIIYNDKLEPSNVEFSFLCKKRNKTFQVPIDIFTALAVRNPNFIQKIFNNYLSNTEVLKAVVTVKNEKLGRDSNFLEQFKNIGEE